MTEATLIVGLEDTGLPRRSLILQTLGLAGGALATVPLVALVGAMIKKPGDQLFHTLFRPNKKLFPDRRAVPIVYAPTGARSARTTSSRAAIATVFPGVREETVNGYDGLTDASSPDAAHPAAARPEGQVPQGPGRLRLADGEPRVRRVLQDLHARRLPGVAVRAADPPAALPVPPVAVRGARGRQAGLRPGHAQPAEAAARRGDRGRTGGSTSSPCRTTRSRSAPASGSGHDSSRATDAGVPSDAPHPARARPRKWVDERLQDRRPDAHAAEQGLPRPLVVHDGRDRALLVHHPAAHRHLPDVLLRPVDGRDVYNGSLRAAARRHDVAGVRVDAATSPSTSAAA